MLRFQALHHACGYQGIAHVEKIPVFDMLLVRDKIDRSMRRQVLPDSSEAFFIVDSGTESFIDDNLLDNRQKIDRDDKKGRDHNQQNGPAHGREIAAVFEPDNML